MSDETVTDELGQETAGVFDDLGCAVEHGVVADGRDLFRVEVSQPGTMYVFAKSRAGAINAARKVSIDVTRYTRKERQLFEHWRLKGLLLVEQEVVPPTKPPKDANPEPPPKLHAVVEEATA